MKRRNFLAASATGLLGLQTLGIHASETEKKTAKKSLRFVHLTDMHIHPKPVTERAIQNLLNEIHALAIKPDFVINSGDNIMDSLKRTKEETASQWEAWHSFFRSKINYELYNCIGNHDVWGWSLNDPNAETDPLFGKSWAVKELELPNRYYSIDRNGWHFIFLDSPFRDKEKQTYTARIDDEQFNWLANDLKQTGTSKPICIVSHIPVISASVFFDGDCEKSGDWHIPGAWMHIDARKLKDLFFTYPNIKLAISGHVHLADQTKYLGINYLCNGAASGAWWQGNYHEFPPMYAIIDLYDDGSFNYELVNYDWKRK